MAEYKSFQTEKNKLEKTWNNIYTNKQSSEELDPIKIIEVPLSTLKKTSRFSLDTDPIFYDLYDFKGITSRQGGGNAPSPLSCYVEDPIGTWNFIYPVFDFRVPSGEDVETFSGCPDWEFQSSIGIIRYVLKFPGLREEDIYSFDLLSYLYNEADEEVESGDFSQFYRWIKKDTSYDFHYHAFFTIPEGTELLLKAELVLVNKKDYNAIQLKKIQN